MGVEPERKPEQSRGERVVGEGVQMKWVVRADLRWSEGGLEQRREGGAGEPICSLHGGASQAHGHLRSCKELCGGHQREAVRKRESAGCRERGEIPQG